MSPSDTELHKITAKLSSLALVSQRRKKSFNYFSTPGAKIPGPRSQIEAI